MAAQNYSQLTTKSSHIAAHKNCHVAAHGRIRSHRGAMKM